jgi:3-hydroxyisobutyrate dehydrogenase-like beta-hydroxyacid dehydrogenase
MPIATMDRKNVGVIGLGIIGSRVAAALRHGGFQAFVWNRTPKPAPNFLGSAAEVAEMCPIIQLFVADAAATLAIVDAIAPQLTAEHTVLCHGTIGLEGTLEAARRVGQAGAQFLDAPFTGSKGAAEKRQLVYYIGGPEHVLDDVRPILDASAKAVIYIGGIGQAAVVKVATNMISAATVQVLAEALALTRMAGIAPEVLVAAVENNAMRSGVTDLKLPKMIEGDYEPHFSVKHMFKDVQLGLALAKKLGVELPETATVAARFGAAMENGWGEMDYAALAKAFDHPNGR